MALFRLKFPKRCFNLVFIYISDDIEWAKDNLLTKAGGKELHIIGDTSDELGKLDLAILSKCNHTIQSYGSFTYFAGFLASGLRIIPQHFSQYRKHNSASKFLDQNPLENPLPELYFIDELM